MHTDGHYYNDAGGWSCNNECNKITSRSTVVRT